MNATVEAKILRRFDEVFSHLTARGAPWNFDRAKPYAEAVDNAAEKWILDRSGRALVERELETDFETMLGRYSRQLSPGVKLHAAPTRR